MAYTYEQQTRLDQANTKVASAQKRRDTALADYTARYANFCDEGWWSYLTDCDIRNVTSKWRRLGENALSAGITAFTNNHFTKKWEKPSSCENAIEKGPILTYSCFRGKGDCIKESTCENKVAEYNGKLQSVDVSLNELVNSTEALKNAQADLKNLLNTISGEVENDPAFQLEKDNILASIKKNRNKLIFIAFALLVIGGVIIWWRKIGSSAN